MKKQKKDEIVDLSTLPKINLVTSSLILDFKNHDRRFKILENIYKNPNKLLRLICRDNIIDFAKEKGIYVEPAINKKDPNPPQPKPITAEELAKATYELIIDKSIPVMKEKKATLDNIEALKKQKEEAIQAQLNPPPVDPKKKQDNKKKEINPDDIIVPIYDENQCELVLVFYNYPITPEEYIELEKVKVTLNNVILLNETDPLIEEYVEEVPEKNKKPVKEAKPNNDVLLMQKLFTVLINNSNELYQELLKSRNESDKLSLLRFTYFDKVDFSYKENEETKKDTIINFQENYVEKMNIMNRKVLFYLNWLTKATFQKFSDERFTITDKHIMQLILNENILFRDNEHISSGSLLFFLCNDIIKKYRDYNEIKEGNKNVFEKNDINYLFENLEKQIDYEILTTRHNSDKQSHIVMEDKKEEEMIQNNMINADDLSSCFKLVISYNDMILKNTMNNKYNEDFLSDREKLLYQFKNFPGISRHLMPVIPPKEQNFRKAKKCEIYPFLGDLNINLYEKFEILNTFENLFQKLIDRPFDFSNRIYQEPMNTDILSQVINNAMLLDPEVLIHYNERDDNMLLATYYRCPKGRIYRKTNKQRYLSKPDFENWVKHFNPTIEERATSPKKSTHTQRSIHNVTSQDISKSDRSINVSVPYENDQILYEADDTYVGQVVEKVKYMFPSDNGVFIKKVIENGIFSSYSSYVVKDNLVFGIKNDSNNIPELWIKFENDVTMTVNYIGPYDQFRDDYDCVNGAYTTLSFKNGLNIQIMPNGDVCQKSYNFNKEDSDTQEQYRVITGKASIVKYNNSEKINIMYANGNICQIFNGMAINTNNKGYRLARNLSNDIVYELDPTPVTIQSDAESNSIYFLI